jgi:hypothetical protein
MDRDPDDRQAALEQRIGRALAGTAKFKAPESLEVRVLDDIGRRAPVSWWRRRVLEWPLPAQLAFALTGVATAAALLLGRPATPKALSAVINQPAAELHATLDVLAVMHRVADTMAGALPDEVWYGGLALCAATYVALFLLIAFGYRLLLTQPHAIDGNST